MTDDTPTPRSDATQCEMRIEMTDSRCYGVPSNFARQLERDLSRVTAERDEAREEAKEQRRQADSLERQLLAECLARKSERDQLAAEKAALETKLSYVTTELITAGVDCGAAPVEELARRVVRKVAELERERDAIQRHLSDGAGKPFFDGSLVEQVMESRREVERERDALERERDELKNEVEAEAKIVAIRCLRHLTVPLQNTNEATGAECGGCIAAERDALKVELLEWQTIGADVATQKALAAALAENEKLRSIIYMIRAYPD